MTKIQPFFNLRYAVYFSFRLDYNNHSENQKNMYTIQFIEGEQKKSTQMFLSLEAISLARVLQSIKISCLLLGLL